MARLISPPLADEDIPGSGGRKRLLRELLIQCDDGRIIRCPEGMTHDGSSVPGRLPLAIVRKHVTEVAGVAHDRLYASGQIELGDGRYVPVTRAQADRYWREIARSGSPDFRAGRIEAFLGWSALKVGGWVAWNAYRRGEDPGV